MLDSFKKKLTQRLQFPLNVADGKSVIPLKKNQENVVAVFKRKIASGQYVLKLNDCLCGNTQAELDQVVVEQDRYGIPIRNILCARCGLIRSEKVLNDQSNEAFYVHEYREIYSGDKKPDFVFFEEQRRRGLAFIKKMEDVWLFDEIDSVLEIGCGAGGVLFPFWERGKRVIGCDYDQQYLAFGKAKGMSLELGAFSDLQIADNSQDLIILSHVMEHFNRPREEMIRIIEKVRPGKFLLVEVPGIFCIESNYRDPLTYFQNAHAFNYYEKYLCVFFKKLGLNVLCGNERCTFIVQKPLGWQVPEVTDIFDDSLLPWVPKVSMYLRQCYVETHSILRPIRFVSSFVRDGVGNVKRFIGAGLEKVGMKNTAKLLFYKINAMRVRYVLKRKHRNLYINFRDSLEKNRVLKDTKRGKRAFLFATGPSLKMENLRLLAGEDCFSVSNFFLHEDVSALNPLFHFFIPYHPPLFLENYVEWLALADKTLPRQTKIFLGHSVKPIVTEFNLFKKREVFYLYLKNDEYVEEIDLTAPVLNPHTGPLMILPVLFYMGYSEIYLLGCDHTALRDYGKPMTHFYNQEKDHRLNASSKNIWQGVESELEAMLRVFKQYRFYNKIAVENGVQILNLSQDSWLDIYPKNELKNVVGMKRDVKSSWDSIN